MNGASQEPFYGILESGTNSGTQTYTFGWGIPTLFANLKEVILRSSNHIAFVEVLDLVPKDFLNLNP